MPYLSGLCLNFRDINGIEFMAIVSMPYLSGLCLNLVLETSLERSDLKVSMPYLSGLCLNRLTTITTQFRV